MNAEMRPATIQESQNENIRVLQEELAQTNREVMALTLELEGRLAQLRAAEERYRRLAENAPDIIYRYELKPSRGFTFINPRATTITGYSPEQFYNDPDLYFRMIHPEDRPLLEAVLRAEWPSSSGVVLRCVHKNGKTIWIEQHHSLVHDAKGVVVAVECIARDITDRRHLEDQLRQAQKMEAVGRLAGGVAHDFNNLLTVITGYSSRALGVLNESDPVYREIREIEKASESAASLTRQLLAFSRRQVLQPQVLSLNEVISDIEPMLRRVLNEDIDLVTLLAPALGAIHADRGQIEQVLMNLIVNARDAMPKGGALKVRTANVTLDQAYAVRHDSVAPGHYAMLEVSDTGHGMDEATRARIFEPFFTTKPQGAGTGLGLSTVYGIVTQSNGSVDVQSEPGKGTTFKIYLPTVSAVPKPAAQPVRMVQRARHDETILVVEDNQSLRELIVAILEDAGYPVLRAGSGSEALNMSMTHAGPIHLLITDLVMPGMSGAELTKQMMASRAQIKVVYMSGYTDNSLMERGVIEPRSYFLQKPFTPATLAAKVRDVLDNH